MVVPVIVLAPVIAQAVGLEAPILSVKATALIAEIMELELVIIKLVSVWRSLDIPGFCPHQNRVGVNHEHVPTFYIHISDETPPLCI